MAGANALEERALAAMAKARSTLVLEHPFFGTLALRMTHRCDGSCRDLWSDGRTLACNPAYAAGLPQPKLVAAVAHEVLHIALGHHVRRGGRDEALWNRACDFAVNCILVDAGFELPDGAPYRSEYAEKSVDDIYAFLAALQDDEGHGASARSEEGQESSQVEGTGASGLGGDEGRENESSSARPGEGDPDGGPLERQGARAGDSGDGLEQDATHDFSGEVRDHPLVREGGGDGRGKAEQESDIAMMQAAGEALRMGSMPGSLLRLVKRRIAPSMDWRELLSRFMEQCSDSDYTWTQPDRRHVWQGLYLPSRRESRLPSIVLAVDCSGSVDEGLLARFCAELSGILDAYDATLTVMFHDVAVTEVREYGRQDLPLSLAPTGGGGTDYRPVAAAVEEAGLEPACMLWFTDLECDRFPDEPPYPVLWVVGGQARTAPPFGTVLSIPEFPGGAG